MSIRQFSGRIFFNDKAINLKIGGPVSEDDQQTVIAMDESTHDIRVIRCDTDALSFQELGRMVYDQFARAEKPSAPASAHELSH